VDGAVPAHPRLASTLQKLLAGLGGIPLYGAAIGHLLAALAMGQTDLGLFPLQSLAAASIWLFWRRFHDRHHPAIHFDDHRRLGSRLLRVERLGLSLLPHPPGMAVGHAPDRALAEQYALVFDQFVHRLGVGHIGPKIRHHALQRA